MTVDDEIGDEKIQYDINRESGKISALSSGKIDKYEYLQAKKYCLLIKVELEKQWNTIENQGEKQIKALEEYGNQLLKSNTY